MKSRCHRFVSGVIKEKRKSGETEVVSNVKIKTNQSTKQINQLQNSEKLINHCSTTSSIILLPLFVINNILNNIIVGLLHFAQTCHYHVFYVVSCHFHMLQRYIFCLVEQYTWSGGTFPDLVLHVSLFCVFLFHSVKRFHKLVYWD